MSQLTTNSAPGRAGQSFPWLVAAGLSAATLFAVSKLAATVRHRAVNLRGKVALITGGSRGLGLALAHELGQYGCELALVARDSAELEAAAAQLLSSGLRASIFPSDITRQAELVSLVDQVLARFGRIDILVNDAGLIKIAPLDDVERADFDEAMDLMFWAPVNLTFAVLPHMKQQGAGHIINIASVGGRVSIPHLLPYSCAKFALVGFSTGLNAELDSDNIHVLTVVPGLMRTDSFLNAKFKGPSKDEFAWFTLLGNLPGISVSAEHSAHSIREALQRREATCIISLPAKLLIHAEALLPEATRKLMQMTTKMLPKSVRDRSEVPGKSLNPKFGALFQALTILGKFAARAFNE